MLEWLSVSVNLWNLIRSEAFTNLVAGALESLVDYIKKKHTHKNCFSYKKCMKQYTFSGDKLDFPSLVDWLISDTYSNP